MALFTAMAIGATAGIIGGGLHLMKKAKQAAERLRQKRTDAMNKALAQLLSLTTMLPKIKKCCDRLGI